MACVNIKQIVQIVFQINIVLIILANGTCASYCTEEQIDSCKKAGADGSLSGLPGGGECQAKRYIQFTHLCTVNNYVPSTEYCCCAHERKILCCRYHYNWNYFRCEEPDDVIDTIEDNSLPQELLLTAILVPVAAAVCCLVCCIRCMCCRDDEDETCGCSKCRPCKNGSEKESSDKLSMGRSKRYEDVQTPLKSPEKDGKKPLSDQKYDEYTSNLLASSMRNGAVPSMPSAPPMDDAAYSQLLPRSSTGSIPSHSTASEQLPATDSGFMLRYVSLQQPGQNPQNTMADLPSSKNSSALMSGNTYHVDPSRFSTPINCCHGNPAQNQTLIGIITNPDGRPIVADSTPPPPPCDPPPAYDAVYSENTKSSLPLDTKHNSC